MVLDYITQYKDPIMFTDVLNYIMSRPIGPNDWVMFDIDDTLIKIDGTPMNEIIRLLKVCEMLDYKILILTARPGNPDNKQWTKQQLAQYGITYDLLAFAPPEHKSTCKKFLMKERGYKFILSVGDLPTDWTDSERYINTSIACCSLGKLQK
jgi:hypothetical protein